MGEVKVTADFLNNFGGDNVRFLARSFGVPGDHYGQFSNGYRWPYGAVAIVAPFNFPLEIPVLQLMGSLFMGNKVSKIDVYNWSCLFTVLLTIYVPFPSAGIETC